MTRTPVGSQLTSVVLIAALTFLGTAAEASATIDPTPAPTATVSPSPDTSDSPTPAPSPTSTLTPEPQRAVVDDDLPVGGPSRSVPSTPLKKAASLPAAPTDPGGRVGTLAADSRVVIVHDDATTAKTLDSYQPWRERTSETPDAYQLVVAAGVATRNQALRGALPFTGDQASLPGARGDLLEPVAPLASAGDAVQVTTVAGEDLDVPGGFFAMDVSTLADTDDEWVTLTLDVSGMVDAYGADALSRMQLVLMPACALNRADDPACVTGTPLPTAVSSAGLMTATVPAHPFGAGSGGGAEPGTSRLAQSGTGSGGVIVAVGAENGQGGTFTATDLSASGDWSVADQTGVFTYALPLAAAPVDAGPAPDLGLYYNSAAVDGHNIATNGQSGLIGDGWSMAQSYIERRYQSCAVDAAVERKAGLSGEFAGDLCYQAPVGEAASHTDLVLSLSGTTTNLIWDSGENYYAESDPTIRVTRVVRSGSTLNGGADSEYFVVQTADGGRYYMGYGRAPGASGTAADHAATNSVALEPVLSDDADEPNAGTFVTRGYRFMMDVAMDASGNAAVYTYARDTNSYARNSTPADSVAYTRALRLSSVDYGMRLTSVDTIASDGAAQARAAYTYKGRCLNGTNYTNSLIGQSDACAADPASDPAQFSDVPVDLICTATCSSFQNAPVYFNTERLSQISTFVNVDGTWKSVDVHQLIQAFPPTSQPQSRSLWLDSVYTRSYNNGDLSDYVDSYAVRFYGTELPNRVDWADGTTDDVIALNKRRITSVIDDIGGLTSVDYYDQYGEANHCPTEGAASSQYTTWKTTFDDKANHADCYQTGFGDDTAIYHRYLVHTVTAADTVTDSPSRTTSYTYEGLPQWAHVRDRLVADAASGAGWTDFRGYQQVTTTVGTGTRKTSTTSQYFTGMSHDWNGTSAGPTKNLTLIGSDLLGAATVEDTYQLRGYLAASVTRDNNDAVVAATRSTYSQLSVNSGSSGAMRGATMVRPAVTKAATAEPAGSVPRIATTTLTYTPEGLPATQSTTITQTGHTTVCTASTTTYARGIRDASGTVVGLTAAAGWNGTSYLIAASESSASEGCGTSAAPTSHTVTLYDNATTTATNTPTRGLATTSRSWLTASTFVESHAGYDVKGRTVWTQAPGYDEHATIAYARGSDGVTQVTTTDVAGNQAHSWVEPFRGNTVRSQDVNGHWTHYGYDAMGLLTDAWAPAQYDAQADPTDQVPTAHFEYDAYATPGATRLTPLTVMSAQYVGKDTNGNYTCIQAACMVRRSYQFYDGFGSVIESQSVSPGGTGGRVVTATEYDSLGQVARVSAPFFNSGAAQFTTQVAGKTVPALVNANLDDVDAVTSYTYDWAGRTTSTTLTYQGTATLTHAPTRTTSTQYEGLTTRSTDAAGLVTEAVTDLMGRLTDQWVYEAGTSKTTGQHTQYGYARASDGTVTSTVTDAEGAVTSSIANMGGQKLSMVDPTAGTTSYSYNPRGQLTQTVNAGSGTIHMTYDQVGRMTDRATLAPGGAVSSSAHWVYATSAGHIGQLQSSTATTVVGGDSFDVTRTYAYDALGRVTGSSVSLPDSSRLGDLSGVDYAQTYTLNELGQVTATSLPAVGDLAAETVTATFNRFGDTVGLATSESSTVLVAGLTRTMTGQLASRTLGNGMVRGYTWDPMDGSLTSAQASYNDGGTQTWVQYDVYGHDDAGRVTSVSDKVVGTTTGDDLAQCYTYDDLNRLAAAWTADAADACATDGTVTSTWAVTPTGYSATWSYSLAGRITSAAEAVVTSSGTDAVTRSYDYDGASPNAVTQLATTSTTGTSTDGYGYDAAGRMTSRDTAGGTQSLTWDPISNLTSVTGGGVNDTYLYDTAGQRVARITATTATAYFGTTEATDLNTSASFTSDVAATRYYTAGGATVAMRTAAGVSFLLGDVQGSATVTIAAGDPATAAISRNAYAPYGVTRGGDQLATDRGWLGQTEDTTTGLTYLNARYYDPVLARFITPDPLLNPADPDTLDPYRYADNNPILFTDATGLNPGCTGSANTQLCWSSYISVNAPSPAVRDKHQRAVKNLKNSQTHAHGTESSAGPSPIKGQDWKGFTQVYSGVDLGTSDFAMGAFIGGSRAGGAIGNWWLGDADSHGDDRGFAKDLPTVLFNSRFSIFYSASRKQATLRVNQSCEYPETSVCTDPIVGPGTFSVLTDDAAIRSELGGLRAGCGMPGQEYCADAVPDWMISFSGKNSALQSAPGGVQSEFVPPLALVIEGYNSGGIEEVRITGSGYPNVEFGTVGPGGSYNPLIQDKASTSDPWAGWGLAVTVRSVSAKVN